MTLHSPLMINLMICHDDVSTSLIDPMPMLILGPCSAGSRPAQHVALLTGLKCASGEPAAEQHVEVTQYEIVRPTFAADFRVLTARILLPNGTVVLPADAG